MGDNKAHDTETQGGIYVLGGLLHARKDANPVAQQQKDEQGANEREVTLFIVVAQGIAHQLSEPLDQKFR